MKEELVKTWQNIDQLGSQFLYTGPHMSKCEMNMIMAMKGQQIDSDIKFVLPSSSRT